MPFLCVKFLSIYICKTYKLIVILINTLSSNLSLLMASKLMLKLTEVQA